MTGPGDGWPWDGDADGDGPGGDGPWSWEAGPDEHLPGPADLPGEAEPPLPELPAGAAGDADPDEPRALPVEAPADWSEPAGWADQPAAAGGPDPFPPALEVDLTPPDGGPWADPDLLGGDDTALPPPSPGDSPAALRADLAAADWDPGADWAALAGSDDPAVRALAALWRPDA